MTSPLLIVENLHKTFTLHNQGGVVLPVLKGIDLTVNAGECVVLHGPSGAGKSSLLRSLYANYKPQQGQIRIRHDSDWMDLVAAAPHEILDVRKKTLGYVSQFLRVIPRVSTLDIVSEPLRRLGIAAEQAEDKARALLSRLRIPEAMWSLAPATFSGGEQQRVNIAHGFSVNYPVLLLDEPTASLDAENRQTVVDLIIEAKARGTAIVGIFHDADVRELVADRLFAMQAYKDAA
ncbi:MAG: phosphonate C-P lyase system protein PhnL [Rhodospirillales bacterium]|nr:phosphonate C-P lyase system protein PhnL [Rhodospirillales bacterium]